MSNFINGAQVDGKAMNVRSNNESINNNNRESEKREELNLAVKASRDIKGLFRVEYGTIANRIRDAKNGKRPLGVVAHGRHRMANGQSFNVYIKVEEKVIDGYSNYVVYVEAGNGKWVMNGLETEVVKVDSTVRGRTQEKALTEAIGAALVRYIGRWFEVMDSAEEEAVEETAKETENGYWDSVVAQTEEYLARRLEECGMNALKLADALVEAYQNTDGAINYGDVPTLALWLNFKAKIVSRLESLGDGAQTAAPGFADGTAGENSNTNDEHPAPGLRDELAGILAADWAQMGDSPLEGNIGEHRMDGRYLLETTRELWADPYMGVCLVRLGDGHEHHWRIYGEGDIPGVADDLLREMDDNE